MVQQLVRRIGFAALGAALLAATFLAIFFVPLFFVLIKKLSRLSAGSGPMDGPGKARAIPAQSQVEGEQ